MFDLTPFDINPKNMFRFFDDFDKRFVKEAQTGFRTDILDRGDYFFLEAELPGFKKEDIKIDLDGDRLMIRASRSVEEEKSEKDYLHRERHYGEFARSFHLENVNVDDITAGYEDGILKLHLPKKQPEKPASRQIEIN